MKAGRLIVGLFILFANSGLAEAEENYLETMKALMERYDKADGLEESEAASKASMAYLNSLDANELILMGRQYGATVEKNWPVEVWGECTVELSLFCGLRDVDTELEAYAKKMREFARLGRNEISDKKQSAFWRAGLIGVLAGCLEKEQSEQELYELVKKIEKRIADPNDHYWVRFFGLQNLFSVLGVIEDRYLEAESVIKKRMAEGENYWTLKRKVEAGQIAVSDKYMKTQVKLASYYDRLIKKITMILADKSTEAMLQRGAIKHLGKIFRRKHLQQRKNVRNALEDVVRNYEKYDEKAWAWLWKYGGWLEFDTQKLEEDMVKNAKDDKTEKRIRLVKKYLNREKKTQAQEENYWGVLKGLIEESAGPGKYEEGVVKLREYAESLTAEQLLIAARQCSAELCEIIEPGKSDSTIASLGFFYKYYPLKTDNLKDIAPLLDDLLNKSQGACWRYSIMQLLGTEWRSKLNAQQCLESAKVMKDVLANTSEHLAMRKKATRASADLFTRAYGKTLYGDPNVKQLISKGMKGPEAIREAKAGRVGLAKETVRMKKAVSDAIGECEVAQLTLFADPNTPTGLKSKIIEAWVILKSKSEHRAQIKTALNDAVHNYRNYKQQLWSQLASANIRHFKNKKAIPILDQMIDEIKNKSKKKNLIRLKKKIEEGL